MESKTNMSPFNGDYYDSSGNIRNLMEIGAPQGATPKDYMAPFNGYFYASDGSVHNIDELGGSGSDSGSGIPEAPIDGKGYLRKDSEWIEAKSEVPKGCILMWSGAVNTIPSGWALCNGSNNTPDLRNRFVVGAGSTYAPGSTGGLDNVTLTLAQIPNHTPTIYMQKEAEGGDQRGLVAGTIPAVKTAKSRNAYTDIMGSIGGGTSHENRPPYYALAYIMKL